MRATGKAALAAIAVFSIGLTGCGDNKTPGGSASAGASGNVSGGASAGASGSAGAGASAGASGNTGGGSTGGGQGTAASCLVGTWKATNLTGKLSGIVDGSFQGGGGVLLTIDSGGKTQVDFGPMQRVAFTLAVSGNDVKGNFAYGGKLNATVKTPASATGNLEPTGTVDFSTLTVTVDLTAPAAVTVADKTPISEFAGTGTADTGGAVDAQPILKKSAYDCSAGNTLKLSPPQGGIDTGTWLFAKA